MTAVVDEARPEDTRSRILGAAVGLIGEKGFAATSTRELCERMGFTKAALWYHFRAKDDLLGALAAPVLDALSTLVDGAEPRPSAAARRRLAVAYVDLVVAHSDLLRVLYDDPSVREHPALALVRPTYRRLYRLLAGTAAPDTAALARARAATGAVHAALLRGEPGEDREVLRDVAVTVACGALGVPAPRSA